ncbi:ribonuclease P protein component [Lutibacter sp.]|uniref:ribonuclease P protein component n=1 Tax=Lutibacter sp. TaxID=1925666 RepID=UPI001A31EC64|nr:ribonuclease P protein component [Lutibacter sp.]MBI9040828.1 ribonuclease P protein component [Lutibacter sp.]
MRYTLGKDEKLKGRKLIELLFSEGKRVKSFPIQLIYIKNNRETAAAIKAGFSVPKRNIKLAVNRNRIKRMLREVYRLNKYKFLDNLKEPYVFMFIYMAKEELNYTELEQTFHKVCDKFLTKIKEDEQA